MIKKSQDFERKFIKTAKRVEKSGDIGTSGSLPIPSTDPVVPAPDSYEPIIPDEPIPVAPNPP